MIRLFSAPIFCGIVLGILFPYQSLSLIWVSSILLFLLLFLNTLAVDRSKLLILPRPHILQAGAAQFLIFVGGPLLLTALASLSLRDPDFIFGVAVGSLAPCALVNPFFARHRGGNVEISLWNVLISTLLCPLATVPMLNLLGLDTVYIQSRFLWVYLLALTSLPVILSFALATLAPRLGRALRPALPTANSLILALLMFILVGSSLNRVPLRLLLNQDFYAMAALFVFADFGLFLILRVVAPWFMDQPAAESFALSVSTRNFAVSASLMLFFHPKAALPSALGLIVHCLFFQYLLWPKSAIAAGRAETAPGEPPPQSA
jgi:predicted Na+-dependent transporter